MNLRVELPDPDESRTSCSARKSRLPHMKGATTPTNYKHPHEWLVFSIFIVKERPWSAVPRGEGCVLYAGAFDWQACQAK